MGDKYMRRVLQAALLALALALVPYTASAAVVQNVTVPLNQTVFNPCNGDTFVASGNVHVVVGMTADGSGGFHLHVDVNVSGVTGTGSPSGITYHGVGGDWFATNVHPPFPAEFTATDVFGLISDGPSPNFVAHDTIHMTINANGSLTAQVTRISITCR